MGARRIAVGFARNRLISVALRIATPYASPPLDRVAAGQIDRILEIHAAAIGVDVGGAARVGRQVHRNRACSDGKVVGAERCRGQPGGILRLDGVKQWGGVGPVVFVLERDGNAVHDQRRPQDPVRILVGALGDRHGQARRILHRRQDEQVRGSCRGGRGYRKSQSSQQCGDARQFRVFHGLAPPLLSRFD